MGHSEGKVLLVLLQLIREGLEELVVFPPVLAAAPRVQEAALHGAGVPVLLLCDKALISFVYGHPLPPNFLSRVKAVVTEHCLVQDVPPVFHGHLCPPGAVCGVVPIMKIIQVSIVTDSFKVLANTAVRESLGHVETGEVSWKYHEGLGFVDTFVGCIKLVLIFIV